MDRIEEPLRRQVVNHLARFSIDGNVVQEELGHGPILESLPGFNIAKLRFRASGAAWEAWIYCTVGVFMVNAHEHIKQEFFVVSPVENFTHVGTLTMLANYHADPEHRLRIGDIVGIGDAWLPGSSCDHLLVSLPYPFGREFEWLGLGDTCVRFLWAMPITVREAAFADIHGYEELESRFDSAGINYLDPNRESVV